MSDNGGLPSPPPSMMKLCFSPEGRTPLKERFRKGKIVDYTADQFSDRTKNATERLRDLDYIRMHTPHEDEVDVLNVTPYRMDLLTTQDVLYLCGGLVGVRFSSDDLMTVLKTTKKMSGVWNELSQLYKNMSAGAKKFVLPKEVNTPEDSEGNCKVVQSFHDLADQYVALFLDLQAIIRDKQKLVDPTARTDAPKLDADPESKQGRKMPEWLSILIEKHQHSKPPSLPAPSAGPATPQPAGNGAAVRSSQIRVGELSVFLSGCMTGVTQSNEAESDALTELVQASNDNVMNVSNADIHAVTDAAGHHRGRPGSPSLFPDLVSPRSRKYWARRFYNFLSKMSELASAVKDEAALDHM